MGIEDRDYYREKRGTRVSPFAARRPWWRKFRLGPALACAGAVLALLSAAVWLYRDAAPLRRLWIPAEGSLIVNLNTATSDQLETLPQIGPARAAIIIQNRPYGSVDDLYDINGIPRGVIEANRPLLTVDGETRSGENRQ